MTDYQTIKKMFNDRGILYTKISETELRVATGVHGSVTVIFKFNADGSLAWIGNVIV